MIAALFLAAYFGGLLLLIHADPQDFRGQARAELAADRPTATTTPTPATR